MTGRSQIAAKKGKLSFLLCNPTLQYCTICLLGIHARLSISEKISANIIAPLQWRQWELKLIFLKDLDHMCSESKDKCTTELVHFIHLMVISHVMHRCMCLICKRQQM